jgi:hypothetical protein
MTPKDKAIELYNKYEQLGRDFTRGVSMKEFAKQCALIAVDEIIKSNPIKFDEDDNCIASYWWLEVKKEIEAL